MADTKRRVPGFDGRKRRVQAPKGAKPPTDPHADLIGLTFPVDTGGEGTVVGTWPLNKNYVELATPAGPTLRVAAQVRRRRSIT